MTIINNNYYHYFTEEQKAPLKHFYYIFICCVLQWTWRSRRTTFWNYFSPITTWFQGIEQPELLGLVTGAYTL